MLRQLALDVGRLTRPARIRCRPHLARQLTYTVSRSKPLLANAEIQRSPPRQAGITDDRIPAFGSQRAQLEDYEIALETARVEGQDDRKRAKTKKRAVKLPSLLKPTSFRPREASRDISSIEIPPAAEASSSQSAAQSLPTLKGKERAIEVDPSISEESKATKGTLTGEDLGRSRNAVGVQLLAPSLHAQLFPGAALPKPPEALLEISKQHLKDNKLSPEGAAVLPEISFDLPPLRGNNIRDHFHALGRHTSEPYYSLARTFMDVELPEMPKTWELERAGWTKYHLDGRMEAVEDLGDETMVSFDVETLYKLSPFPVMATAASATAWYSWLCPTLFEKPPDDYPVPPTPWDTWTPSHHPHDLIPLFKGSDSRVVIGHNVGYDRARVVEEYSLERTATRWLDTLSLHVATRGITSVQRPAWMVHRKNKKAKMEREAESLTVLQELAEENGDADMLQSLQDWGATAESAAEAMESRWQDVTSVNSLADVAALHCGIPVDKSIRNRFADESIKHASQLRPELHDLLSYCAKDVKITHDVYKKVLPLFFESCPHPASFAGMLSMGNSFLPVDESWEEYLRNAETKYKEMDEGVKKALRVLAEKLRKEGLREGDPWASQLDWTPKKARWAETGSQSTPETSSPSPIAASSVIAEVGRTGKVELAPSPLSTASTSSIASRPAWFHALAQDRTALISLANQKRLLPLILRMSYKDHPVAFLSDHYWCFMVPHDQLCEHIDAHGEPVAPGPKDKHLDALEDKYAFFRIAGPEGARKTKLVAPAMRNDINKGILSSPHNDLLKAIVTSDLNSFIDDLWKCAEEFERLGKDTPWGQQLDWSPTPTGILSSATSMQQSPPSVTPTRATIKVDTGIWPKWYWDLTGPPSRLPTGALDLTFKKTVAPLLLRLQWQGYPLVHSRTHKWLYRVPRAVVEQGKASALQSRGDPVVFDKKGPDVTYAIDRQHVYFRLPHKDGEGKNVGNPLSKYFVKSIESGELASAAAESGDDAAAKAATDATNMNALCSYWISSRERIMDQMVVYRDKSLGMILPQVITMGTVTRRAVEATWLTASNAKKNRVGSELKAMVRAPPGYSIVGADVDSEELWISSVMGDSQFGMHGATAIGWMTLEGTKSAGTDLHSKTASILGISRDDAKVFNYSRIYGAGKKHAVQLLLQGDSKLTKEAAYKLADNLYKETKGAKAVRNKHLQPARIPSLWHGGSESYLFNTLEAIALSDRPTTPALGCGVTKALRKSYLEEGSSYLPSRVNWVVQSSGVDYLHLLIISMEYLIKRYDIKARYLISVHDEVRYLSKEEDRYRTALALQIANMWTRALFCYNLNIDNMPQSVAFFSAVDLDHVLRKEVFLTCQTPSHPNSIPPGESLDIAALLQKTNGGALALGRPSEDDAPFVSDSSPPVALFQDIKSISHQRFLEAQANKQSSTAKAWLDSLSPVVDGLGQVKLPDLRPNFK